MSESNSTAASDSSEGASAASIQSGSSVHSKPEPEQQCTTLSESECVAPPLNANHVTKSALHTKAPPQPTLSHSVATQTTSPGKEETGGTLMKGDTERSDGALDKEEKEESGGPSGVGEASKGVNQATQEESKAVCGGSPDGKANSETIARQNTSGDQAPPPRVESQEVSCCGNHDDGGYVNVRLGRCDGRYTLDVAVKADRKDCKDIALSVAQYSVELARIQERNPSSQSSLQCESDIHHTLQSEIPKLPSNEQDNKKIYTNKD